MSQSIKQMQTQRAEAKSELRKINEFIKDSPGAPSEWKIRKLRELRNTISQLNADINELRRRRTWTPEIIGAAQ